MKKLIVLILILVITSFVVVSKDNMSLDQKIETEKSKNPNPKNKNWEYVKDRLFDEKMEKVFKREGPILFSLDNASKQDSLVVNEIIKELRTVIPNKTIDYFKNFAGVSLEIAGHNGYDKKYKEISFYDLVGSTTVLNFNKVSDTNRLVDSQGILSSPNEIGSIEREIFGPFSEHDYTPICISFDINKKAAYKERKKYIRYEILRTLCYLDPTKLYPVCYNRNGVFETSNFDPDRADFNELDKFLLQKLYSDDFIDQFKTYMYANYPWHYASSFINKKEHNIKVFAIIISLGVLVFVLILSFFQNRKYKYSYLNYLFPTFFVFINFINFCNIYNYLTNFDSITTCSNIILFQFVLSVSAASLISFLLWGLEKISFKGNESLSYQLILKVSYTFIVFVIPMVLLGALYWGSLGVVEFMFPYVFFSAGLAFGRGLLLYLNHFSESLVKEKDLELSRLKEAKAEAEVKALQSQINPHFLYNALNSIASLAHTDANKTEKMALSLSDLFRHSINQKNKKVNTLKDELSLIQNYLEIEQIRFGDRLKFSIDVEPDLLAVEIPMFMLQPLIENAVKHGVSKIEGQGEIVLKVNKKDKGILISVQDNGPDFPEGLVSGHGLQTVYDLLRFSYRDKAEISWYNQPKKEITIYIATV
ncbi:sensor histidine kinase [Flavobacterium sp. WC2509]|uniref:sensor histidine kinase n=1 Tax=Flavobacterium sp. WC2509 TaxID=3461406 RepID=UPI0040447B13